MAFWDRWFIEVGDRVRIKGSSLEGIIEEIEGDMVKVFFEADTTPTGGRWVHISHLEPVGRVAERERKAEGTNEPKKPRNP